MSQGRLPIRVELKGLTEEDLYTILTKTENNLIQQQIALLAVYATHSLIPAAAVHSAPLCSHATIHMSGHFRYVSSLLTCSCRPIVLCCAVLLCCVQR